MFFFMVMDASCELVVGLTVDYKSYLQHETVYLYVDILNDSDETFIIDVDDPANPSKLEFEVKCHEKMATRTKVKSLIVENLRIMPDERRKMLIDVTSYYEMGALGDYVVRAVLTGRQESFISKRVDFDVVPGFEIARMVKRAPGYYTGDREYKLIYWNREGFEYLFLRVDAPEEGMNFGVVQLGTLIRVMMPKLDVDRQGNITVFHQARPTRYLRTKFKSDYQGLTFVDQESLSDVVE